MIYYHFHVATPIITVPPKDSAVVLGGNVTFTCIAIGIPSPIITWSSDSNASVPATSNTVSGESTSSTLTLNNLMLSDFNQSYTCNASNEHGTTSESAVLIQGSELLYIHKFLYHTSIASGVRST